MRKPRPKIGCYCRVSTRDKQTTKSQRHSIREWARSQRIQPDQLKWYEDRLTGAKAERPALSKIIDGQRDATKSKIGRMLVDSA